MRGSAIHERRWSSDTAGSSSSRPAAADDDGEFVEVTLDFQDDDTVIIRSVELAGDSAASGSRSPAIGRTSSSRIRQFSQELKAEAVAKAKQISQELKAELRRLSWGHGRASAAAAPGSAASGIDSALAERAQRRRRAELSRMRSGAHKALRGLRFISRKTGGVDSWGEVGSSFDKLANGGFLSRADFAQCIGMKDSKEFALEIFDTLSRRRRLTMERISREELFEFWTQITDQSFDSRLQIFFDMYKYETCVFMHKISLHIPQEKFKL